MACIAETELQQTSTQVDNSGAMGQGATQTTEAAQSEVTPMASALDVAACT